jgi:prepilin-type N-terminal cleavage/methylation domain-containing protein
MRIKEPRTGRQRDSRNAFTLVELLVVIAIIGALAGLILPAIQSARESSRRMQCVSNLRQVGISLAGYEASYKKLPPGAVINYGTNDVTNSEPWGVYGRLLPFVEQQYLLNAVNLGVSWEGQMSISDKVLPIFQCPSDPNATRLNVSPGKPSVCPINFGFNHGTWMVYDPVRKLGGDGVFFPNSFLRLSEITDGLSNTLMAAEVKTWQTLLRNGGTPSPTPPATVDQLVAMMITAPEFRETGHTEWPEGRLHQTGFTATFPPNTKVIALVGGRRLDMDYSSWEEGADGMMTPTYGAVTSRSHHVGMVNALRADGSTTSYVEQIDSSVWKALATRRGGEANRSQE